MKKKFSSSIKLPTFLFLDYILSYFGTPPLNSLSSFPQSAPSRRPDSLRYQRFLFEVQHLRGVVLTRCSPSQVLLNSLQLGSHSWRMNIPTFKMETVILPGKGLFNICLDTIDKWFLYNDFGPQFSQTKVFFLPWLGSLSFPLILVMPPRCSPSSTSSLVLLSGYSTLLRSLLDV